MCLGEMGLRFLVVFLPGVHLQSTPEQILGSGVLDWSNASWVRVCKSWNVQLFIEADKLFFV